MTAFDHWAIVELMGHQMIAGHVTEETVGGSAMLRVDVPEQDGQPAFTKYFGAQAVYAISPVSEEAARRVARDVATRPVQVWSLETERVPALPSGDDGPDGDGY